MSRERVSEVMAAVPAGAGRVEVLGEGAGANELRAALAITADGEDAPAVVVETTGAADAIASALSRVRDLGTVVLAGPGPEAPVALDLYSDVHVRGLTLVGVPAPPGS